MGEELKPCPFPNCGCVAVNLNAHGNTTPHSFYVICVGCGARGPTCLSKQEAAKLWNAAPRRQEASHE